MQHKYHLDTSKVKLLDQTTLKYTFKDNRKSMTPFIWRNAGFHANQKIVGVDKPQCRTMTKKYTVFTKFPKWSK